MTMEKDIKACREKMSDFVLNTKRCQHAAKRPDGQQRCFTKIASEVLDINAE